MVAEISGTKLRHYHPIVQYTRQSRRVLENSNSHVNCGRMGGTRGKMLSRALYAYVCHVCHFFHCITT